MIDYTKEELIELLKKTPTSSTNGKLNRKKLIFPKLIFQI